MPIHLGVDPNAPTCPFCDKYMVKRGSAYGEFWGCSGWPTCKGIIKIKDYSEPEPYDREETRDREVWAIFKGDGVNRLI